MGQYLNSKEPYDQYKTVMNGPYFVDKTEILEERFRRWNRSSVSSALHVRTFWKKRIMATMIAAFFEYKEAVIILKTCQSLNRAVSGLCWTS